MKRLILAAAFVVAATPASWAMSGGGSFNPGTTMSYVLESLPPGCSFGLAAPSCSGERTAPAFRHKHRSVRSEQR